MTEFVIVVTTVDDRAVAEAIAAAAVERRLAACARIAVADSVYRWDGAVQRTPEFVVEMKTTAAAAPALEAAIRERHSYELPEIVVLPILGGSRDYLDWLAREVSEPV
jgi:periplasmic divalent cation tolerance protein